MPQRSHRDQLFSKPLSDPPVFRAIVLHELAHLRNGDIDKLYLVRSVFLGFCVGALVPFLVTLAWQPLGDIIGMAWRVGAFVALIYLTGAAVLRARELYADVRASAWDTPTGALGRFLSGFRPSSATPWSGYLALHPEPADRRRLLDDTRPLFRQEFWEPFVSGVAAMLAFPMVLKVFRWLTLPIESVILAPGLAGLTFAPLLVGVAGTIVWRGTFAAMCRGEPIPSVSRPALGLALGLLTGHLLALETAIGLATVDDIASLALYRLAWGAVVAATCYGILRWMQLSARVWLEIAAAEPSPRPIYMAGLASAALIVTLWLGILIAGDALVWLDPDPLFAFLYFGGLAYRYAVNGFLLVPSLAALWAFPLASLVWRGRARPLSSADWAYLEQSAPAPPAPMHPLALAHLHPRRVLAVSVMGALLYCALLVGIRLLVRALVEATRDTAHFIDRFVEAMFGLGIFLQLVVAAIEAARHRPFGAVHGLFAAWVAGALMVVGFVVVNLGFGNTPTPWTTWRVYTEVAGVGALLSIPVATLASVVAGRLRHPRP